MHEQDQYLLNSIIRPTHIDSSLEAFNSSLNESDVGSQGGRVQFKSYEELTYPLELLEENLI